MNNSINIWIEFLILSIFFIPIVVNDIRSHRIPDILIYTYLGIIIFLRIFFKYNLSYQLLINLLVGFGFIGIICLISKGKIGLGDAKLSGLIALTLGLRKWLIAMFIAAITGIFFSLIRIWAKKMKKEEPIPFAPFLAVGSVCSFFLGDYIIRMIYGISL